MSEFNSDEHYISTIVSKNPLEQWSSHHSHRESEMQYLDAISKMTE